MSATTMQTYQSTENPLELCRQIIAKCPPIEGGQKSSTSPFEAGDGNLWRLSVTSREGNDGYRITAKSFNGLMIEDDISMEINWRGQIVSGSAYRILSPGRGPVTSEHLTVVCSVMKSFLDSAA